MTSAHDSNDIRILEKQCVSLAKKNDNDVFLVAKGKSFNYKNVNVIGIGDCSGGRISRILRVSKLIYNKSVEIDADIYQFHDPELLLYARRLKKKGKLVIFDSHENYEQQIMEKQYIPRSIRGLIRFLYLLIENWACKSIDGALYPDEDNPYIGRVKECIPIYNTPLEDELCPYTPFEGKEPTVCCVGTLSDTRGIKYLMRACYKANVKLILAGNFSPPEFEEELRKEESFSIVDYRGVCTREEVEKIYDESLIGSDTILKVGQYPFTNCLSTKVYEYMMMKMPYITSNFEYNKKIIDEYHCGIYVDPANVEEIASAILYLINNPSEAKRMGENGRLLVEEKFSWRQDEERLYKLYDRLFERRN